MANKAERLKTYCEIAAYSAAALFLVLKLASGQYNHGMDVSLALERSEHANDPSLDLLAITVNFKRPDRGRIEITDIYIETSDVTNPTSFPKPVGVDPRRIKERAVQGGKVNREGGFTINGIFLPPSDGTHLAFLATVKRSEPVLVEATILAKRTGPSAFVGRPQWRVSAISLPKNSAG